MYYFIYYFKYIVIYIIWVHTFGKESKKKKKILMVWSLANIYKKLFENVCFILYFMSFTISNI